MNTDELAKLIAASIARHQTRGLVDDATGLTDVVIHGRVNLLAVAEEVRDAALSHAQPVRQSWARWFRTGVETRRKDSRQAYMREKLAEQLENGMTPVEEAIVRLRLRDLDLDLEFDDD